MNCGSTFAFAAISFFLVHACRFLWDHPLPDSSPAFSSRRSYCSNPGLAFLRSSSTAIERSCIAE